MKHKYAQTVVPVHDLIARRWSSRAFDADAPVSETDLLSMLEAARWAPTCFHEQPWRFLVFDRFRDEEAWKRAHDCLSEWNAHWAERAPLLLLVVATRHFTKTGELNRWSAYDTGAAVENLVLQATSLGLTSRQIGGFEEPKTRAAFEIPDEYELMAFVALGHPTKNVEHLYEKHQEAESAVRTRMPLEKSVFSGRWGSRLSVLDEGMKNDGET